jgi:RNase H-fold protein (predicted Holliday junction resolvase)
MYLHEARKKKKDRSRLDHYAAAVILERYLDALR